MPQENNDQTIKDHGASTGRVWEGSHGGGYRRQYNFLKKKLKLKYMPFLSPCRAQSIMELNKFMCLVYVYITSEPLKLINKH